MLGNREDKGGLHTLCGEPEGVPHSLVVLVVGVAEMVLKLINVADSKGREATDRRAREAGLGANGTCFNSLLELGMVREVENGRVLKRVLPNLIKDGLEGFLGDRVRDALLQVFAEASCISTESLLAGLAAQNRSLIDGPDEGRVGLAQSTGDIVGVGEVLAEAVVEVTAYLGLVGSEVVGLVIMARV